MNSVYPPITEFDKSKNFLDVGVPPHPTAKIHGVQFDLSLRVLDQSQSKGPRERDFANRVKPFESTSVFRNRTKNKSVPVEVENQDPSNLVAAIGYSKRPSN